ncbi:MAG: DUF5615 family PIN-like protein [Planctomycetota bacterium]
MKFVADAHISRSIVDFLEEKRHEVAWANQMAPGKADPDLLSLAASTGAVVLTMDSDFGELVFKNEQRCAGVIYLRLGQIPVPGRVDHLGKFWPQIEAALPGNFVTVTEAGIRVRPVR